MNQGFFWNDWHGFYRLFYKILLGLFILSGIIYGISYFWGSSIAMGWEVQDRIERLVVPIGSFDVNIFNIDWFADNFLVFQEYRGSSIDTSPWTAYFLLGLTAFFLIIYLSITSALKRFWYFIFTALAIVFLLSLKFEQVLLFEANDNRGFVIALLFYIPLSYYFHAFAPGSTLKIRLLAFSGITLLFAFFIHQFAGVDEPFLYLANYGVITPITITAIFILITAQEFIYLFLWIITRSANTFSKNNTIHFTVISLIYIINLILVWLKNTQSIDWNILYIDAFFLFPAAAILGVWGFKKKGETLQGVLNFEPWGGILYLTFGVVAFGTLSYFFIRAQDPIIEAFEDLIIYAQFGLGLLFFVYIIANFYTLIANNMKVYRVVYDPKRMPYVTANIAGLVAAFALFAKSDFFALDQVKSGYYNGLGDLYYESGDDFAAESYYQLGVIHSLNNHRSNYSIATVFENRGQPKDALFFYKKSILKKPTPQSYVNTAHVYKEEGLFFDALFTLQEGVRKFPRNGAIKNNLGLLYSETSILDSAALYLTLAAERKDNEQANSNLLGIIAKNDALDVFTTADTDSLAEVFRSSSHPALRNNLLVNLNKNGIYLPYDPLVIPDTNNTLAEVAFLENQLVHFRNVEDSINMHEAYAFADTVSLGVQDEDLHYALVIRDYFSGNINRSIRRINDMRTGSFSNRERFGLVLGKFLMARGAFEFAADILEESGISNSVVRNYALCLSELKHYEEARQAWERVVRADSLDGRARTMLQVLEMQILPAPEELDDPVKYLLSRYGDFTIAELEPMVFSIEHDYLKPMAYLELYKRAEDRSEAERLYGLVRGNTPVQGFVSHAHMKAELDRLAEEGDPEKLKTVLESINSADPNLKWDLFYYRTLVADNPDAAKVYYQFLTQNAFYEKGILAAVNAYLEEGNLDHAYSIILEAVEVNPYSDILSKKYVELALMTGLESYAIEILNSLENRMKEEEFELFMQEMTILRDSLDQNFN